MARDRYIESTGSDSCIVTDEETRMCCKGKVIGLNVIWGNWYNMDPETHDIDWATNGIWA